MFTIKKVALTFDDGPNPPYTEQILDILKKEKIKATFFVCGTNMKRYPQTAKREIQEGHKIGNHTTLHSRLSYLLGKTFEEAQETQTMIDKLDPKNKKLFRFPWGIEIPWVKRKLIKNGYQIIPVGTLGDDWQKGITAEKIAQNVLKHMNNSTIITLHDGAETQQNINRSQTVKAFPTIFKTLKKQGYEFITFN